MDSLLAIYPTGQKVEEVLKRQSRDRCRLGHRVVTFPELIGTLSREVGDTRLPLAPADERLVIEAVWDHIRGGVTGAAPVHAAWGRNLLQTIRQLKGAALFPEDLARAVSSLGSSAPEYLSTLLSAFRGYEEHLRRRHLADAHDRERAVLDFLHRMEDRGGRPKSLQGVSRLLVAEIYDFSLLQFMIVASLIRLIGDAMLTIQARPFEVDASRFAELTWNRFVEDESLSDKVLPEFVCREGRPGMLGFVLRHLFTQSAPSPPLPDQTLTVVETPSRRDEVEFAAREIRRLLDLPAGEQLPLDRIALAARDLEPYRDALRSAFKRYGIPLRLHCETPLISNPLAQFVLRLLRTPLAYYHRDHLVALTTSPYLGLRRGENYAALLKQVGYIDEVTAPLEERIGLAERELREASEADKSGRGRAWVVLEQLRRTSPSLQQLVKNLRSLDSSGNAAVHARRLSNLLAELDFDRVAASLSGPNASAARAIGEALEKMARTGESIAPDWDLNLDQFARLVESTFSATAYEEFGAPTNAVQAFSILDARGLDFDLVFILGLNDGVFPCARAPDPLLPDHTRIALNRPLAAALRERFGPRAPRYLGRLLRTASERQTEDWFLFFLALSIAERKAVLSYALRDDQGNELLPSEFIREIERLSGRLGGPGPAQRAPQDPASLDECFSGADFINFAAAHKLLGEPWLDSLESGSELDSIRRRLEIERQRARYFELPARERLNRQESPKSDRFLEATRFDGRVSSDPRLRAALVGTAGQPWSWSGSKLNELAACGFKFFAHHLLALSEEEDRDHEYSALEGGELVHDLLAELFKRKIHLLRREEALAQARLFLDQFRPRSGRSVRDPKFWEIQWENTRATVEEVIEFEVEQRRRGEPAPSESEFEYRVDFTLSDVRDLPADERISLAFTGRIDRLELYRENSGRIGKVRVLDYKNSRDAKRYAQRLDPEGGDFGVTEFQLPVYLMGALDCYGSKLAANAQIEAGYLVLRSRDKLKSYGVERSLVEITPEMRRRAGLSAKPSIAERVIELVSTALAGQFDVDPLRCDWFCPYRPVCRYRKSDSS